MNEKPPLRCDKCHQLCDDWTSFDGGVVVVCAPCLTDGRAASDPAPKETQ